MRLLNILITLILILLYSKQIDKDFILFLISGISILLFANFQNDYVDREIDLRKGKRKLIISPGLQLALLVISLLTSFFISFKVFFLFLIMAILINFYNLIASKKPYGFLITTLVVSIGIFSLGPVFGFKESLIYLVIFAFLFNLVREIVKSFIDYDYDYYYRETLAIKISKSNTRLLIKSLLVFILISLIFCEILIKSLYFLLYILIFAFLIILYFLNFYSEKILSHVLKLLMLLGFLSLLL
ncbi:MAG: UbiA family prenyltransferase [candidate division WOR-3 bacterium]